jgi:hypothetical protein
MNQYLKSTPILDFDNPEIRELIRRKGWKDLADAEKIRSIYNFVRDEIKFGYNTDDSLPASKVLADGYGQCNTKANLFMALLRAVGIPNRLHGFTIEKDLQKGAITGIWYKLSPKNIIHTWVEVYLDGKWYQLEGLILDSDYLSALQEKFQDCKTSFCGYAVATEDLQNPQIDWNYNNTYIQKDGINKDFGLFDTPDDFYLKHKQNLGNLKQWVFRNLVRHLMNRNVARIRRAA